MHFRRRFGKLQTTFIKVFRDIFSHSPVKTVTVSLSSSEANRKFLTPGDVKFNNQTELNSVNKVVSHRIRQTDQIIFATLLRPCQTEQSPMNNYEIASMFFA